MSLSRSPDDRYCLGFLNDLKTRTIVARTEGITPLGDLSDFAELAG